MTTQWQPYHEPLRTTLIRNLIIALVAGALLARAWGGMARWPLTTLLMLWPSLGGHLIEIWFLNWLRPRLPDSRAAQVAARVALWFVGGAALSLGMCLTAEALANPRPAQWPPLWAGGLAFIGLELVAQLFLQLRGRPSFYNGRG